MNIAAEVLDRHVAAGAGDRVAVRWLPVAGTAEDITYAELRERSARFAALLRALQVAPGDRVSGLLGRVPDLHVALLGTLRARSVFSPLFAAFGPEPVRQRLVRGSCSVLVTTPDRYARKVAPIRPSVPTLRHVLLVDPSGGAVPDAVLATVPGGICLRTALAAQPASFPVEPTGPDEMALLHFTSGTTGMPKGAVHVHRAVAWHRSTAVTALGLGPDDTFWCTADPGWVTGTSYGVVAPLAVGATLLLDEGEFDAARWWATVARERVTVWYTAPTAIRMLMRAGGTLAAAYDLSRVRVLASVGEPLHAAGVRWGEDVVGTPVRDTWWQTETGGIMIANAVGAPVRPGSMGRPLPGVTAAVLRRGDDGRAAVAPDGTVAEADDDETGELAIRAGWPAMFHGYLDEPERTARCFAAGWYLTGDLARRDPDGWFWFVGRADDVIKSAGHLVGPFEVEAVLLGHPSVAEAAVIGLPDPVMGERIQAYVSLRPGSEPSDGLRRDILAHARRHLGPAVAPRAVVFADSLPRTRSGKIMRRLLKARELGLAEGDLSTLEGREGSP